MKVNFSADCSAKSSQSLFSDTSPSITPCDASEKPELADTNGPDLLDLKFLNVVDAPSADIRSSSPPSPAPLTPSSVGSDFRFSSRASSTPSPSPPPCSPSPPSLFSGALSAVLHNPGATLKVAPSGSPALDHLRVQLREMRDELDLLKSQHKKEVKLLMSELDEEKKVRLSLQVEVDKIKKQLAKSS
ncbi:hypothetical protein ACEWY4_010505 [Coilia grayii]|uniref:SH3 domain-containing kinase-binding protein 1 n=1 Tax=Coilia grayii TaxID=363190 RepID=A0ABD1K238_9TELE